MKKILLQFTSAILCFSSSLYCESALGFDDISRAGGVSLEEVQPAESEDGRRTIQLDGMTLNLGATEAERLENYRVLNEQYRALKQWFLGEFEESVGRYRGLGAFLWKKIEGLASGMTEESGNSQENIRKYMQMIIFAQSLKDRHQRDVALIPASAPEHEFYFRLVERPAGRLFALTEDFDSETPRYPVKVKVDTQSTGLRIRGIQNANEVLGSLPKGTVVEAQAVMLKGLAPVGYRIIVPGNSSLGRRNGFLAGAYLAVENGATTRMLVGDHREELTGINYLYEKIWQSVRAGAEARGLSAAALLEGEAATVVTTEAVAATPSVSSDFWDAIEHWSQSVSEDLSPLRTAEGQVELQLPAQFQELANAYPFFDPRNGGINQDILREMIAKAKSQEEVDKIQVMVNEMTGKFSALLRPIEDPSPTAQTDSVFFYLENAKKFRELEKQIADVNARLAVAAGAEGLDLSSVTRATPLLFELKSAVESDAVKEYFNSGRMNLSSLAQRFGDARARPYRAQVLGNLRTAVDKVLAINISRLTQEVRQRNNPEASEPDAVTDDSVADAASVTNSEIVSDVVAVPAPAIETTPSQPVYDNHSNFSRYAFSFVHRNQRTSEEIPFVNGRARGVGKDQYNLIFSYAIQRHLFDRLGGQNMSEDNKLAQILYFNEISTSPKGTTAFFDGIDQRDSLSGLGGTAVVNMEAAIMGIAQFLMQNPSIDLSALGSKKGEFLTNFHEYELAAAQASTRFGMYILVATGSQTELSAVSELWTPALTAWEQILSSGGAGTPQQQMAVRRLADALVASAGRVINGLLPASE